MTTKRQQTLKILPGLFASLTQKDAENRWFAGSNVRFEKGLPEKVGGWAAVASNETFLGACRQLFDWTAIDGSVWTAIGTNSHLYVMNEDLIYDITPLDEDAPGSGSGTLGTDPFSVTNGDETVTVTHTAHGRVVGDYVVFDGATAVGGITVDGEYAVATVVDANSYTIEHSVAATSTASGGGSAVDYEYLIPTGNEVVIYVNGWGVGEWSHSGGWGNPAPDSSVTDEPRIWIFDKWGEDLRAAIRDGKLFGWDKSAGETVRAARISNSPDTMKWMLVTDNRQVVAFGAHDGSNDDPLLIRWTDEENDTDWTAGSADAAGDLRIDRGGQVMTALHGRSEIVVFTDVSVYAFRFVSAPFYWGLNSVGQNVGIIGPNAAVAVNGVIYFMGREDFHVYDGVLRVLDSDIHERVFGDLNKDLGAHVYAAVNSDFTEIWFCYPTEGSSENDRIAVYNYVEDTWTLLDFERTAFHDASSQFAKPYGVDNTNNIIYRHEVGSNADDVELTGYLESYLLEIGEGDQYVMIDRLIPDFERLTGTVTVTLNGQRYAQGGVSSSKGPYTVTSSTEKIDTRLRAKQVELRIDFEGENTDWRMGFWRVRGTDRGRR